MIFCDECGYTFSGQYYPYSDKDGGWTIYRHSHHSKDKCNSTKSVQAIDIEQAVLTHLFDLFGNVSKMKQAIERAIPDTAKIKKLNSRKGVLEKKLLTLDRSRSRILNMVDSDDFNPDLFSDKLTQIKEDEKLVQDELNTITPQLQDIPSEKVIDRTIKLRKRMIERIYKNITSLQKMSYKNKRELVEYAFQGETQNGKRAARRFRQH